MYARPQKLDEALDFLDEGGWTLLAGGTDHYPARVDRPLAAPVLDISAIAELRGVTREHDYFRIGALTTWTDIARAELPPAFDGLKLAAAEVGSVQVQNAGTIAGNLCNASPAADGVPPLLTLDAEVETASTAGVRRLPLAAFVLGNRRTALTPGEMVTAILVPTASAEGRAHFLKLGARKFLVISIVMAAVRLHGDEAAIAVGACAETARRLPELEAEIRRGWTSAEPVPAACLARIAPIDDIRADAAYRRDMAAELVRRALKALGR